MSENARPSIDPADNDSMVGLFRTVLSKFLASVDDMLPARVVAYDRDTNRASVQPLVQLVTTAGQRVSRAPVASVPVLNIGGGGFILSFPINPGDLGWIKASDRDISLFLQSYTESEPNTARKHVFADALFIPDVMTGWSIAGEDAGNAVLQSLDGTVRIALWPDKIKMTAPSVEIDAAATSMTGTLEVTGLITATAGLTTPADVVAGTISLATHLHSGVIPGGGNSGGPVP